MSWVALGALLAVCGALGWAWLPFWAASGDGRATRVAIGAAAGWVGLAALLVGFSLLAIPWRGWTVGPALAVGIALGRWLGRRRRPAVPPALSSALGWGDAVAALALLVAVVLAARGELLFPDFVYHWGIKTQKFALAQGVDWAYLADPWDANHQRPEYPHLVPSLGAATILLAGRFDASAVGLWSFAALILTAVALRGVLAGAGVGRATLQSGVAWAGLTLGMIAIPYQLAGSADPYMAAALMLALPALLAPARSLQPGHDVQLGIAAALAATAKLEGLPLAALLLALHAGRRCWAARRPLFGAVGRAALPVALVVGPWLLGVRRLHLDSQVAGKLDLERAPMVFGTLWELMQGSGWLGMAYLLLLAPLVLLRRELATAGAVLVLQMGFYLYVYLSAPSEPRIYLYTTFARVVLHVLPAAVAALLIAGDRRFAGGGVRAPAAAATAATPSANVHSP